jgi:primosomal protein N' (replication factor Y)
MKYVDVIVDNNSDNTDRLYTYGCEEDGVRVGSKVYVPFARGGRIRPAYVFSVAGALREDVKGLKYVERLDDEVSLDEDSIRVCEWMRKRYYCRHIEALNCFLPVGSPLKNGRKRRPEQDAPPGNSPALLTAEQEQALRGINPWIEKQRHRTFLIHGVTGSGKTELYMSAAERCVAAGRQVIVLAPEISLTPQTIARFTARFGRERVAVLHSRLSKGERYDEWMRVKNGEAAIAIGARSAVFAPFGDLGLIVVDEEHESTYKSDMSPKYDTIEVAIKRARRSGAAVLLGSATPSLVSSHRVEKRLYEKITLSERYNKTPLPDVKLVDMREELRNGNKSMFSVALAREMESCAARGKQIILFLNRRGYSTFVSCRNCGYVMRCANCGISLTYHKAEDEAFCHLCGAGVKIPKLCPECDSRYLRFFGAGTEKLEEAVNELFPGLQAERMDLDSVRPKDSARKILERFRKGKTQILIGTQLVAKGLDFRNVGLVGIVSADVALNIPDFRSAERAFQLMTQAAGRAGRGREVGTVVIQSYKPGHYAVRAAAAQDYQAFYSIEIMIRRSMGYPPFCDLLQVMILSDEESAAREGAEQLLLELQIALPDMDSGNVLGPRPAPVAKANSLYRYQLYIKVFPRQRELFEDLLREKKDEVRRNRKLKYKIMIDVNPYSFM